MPLLCNRPLHNRGMDSFIKGPAVLFAPANRPERFAKAAAAADMVILDLEDGAGNCDRDQARANILNSDLDPQRTIFRTCGPHLPEFAQDVEAFKRSHYEVVCVPKIGSKVPEEVRGMKVIALIETPAAVANIDAIASHPDVIGLYFGAEDLNLELGGTHSRYQADEGWDGPGFAPYRHHILMARATMLMYGGLYGKFCLDAVNSDFTNLDSLYKEAADAARSGFAGTCCIHPKQVETIRRAYAPDQKTLEWAQRIVEETAKHEGAFKLDGEMVDAPLIAQAHRLVDRAR